MSDDYKVSVELSKFFKKEIVDLLIVLWILIRGFIIITLAALLIFLFREYIAEWFKLSDSGWIAKILDESHKAILGIFYIVISTADILRYFFTKKEHI